MNPIHNLNPYGFMDQKYYQFTVITYSFHLVNLYEN